MSVPAPWISALGLDAVIRRLPVAVVVIEAGSLRVVEFNDRARAMAESQLGRPVPGSLADWWDMFHNDGRPYLLEEQPVVRSITSGEEIDGEEYFSLHPDGSRMIVRSNSAPIYNDHGEIVAGVLVMEDVTGQRRLEEQLARHASLLENVEDAVVCLDASFRITTWNRGAEQTYGWRIDEVLGKQVPSFVQLELSDRERAEIRREMAEQGRWRGETTVTRKDGSTVTVEMINLAIRDARGAISGYLGIHRDITERKLAEQQRAYHAELLENLDDAVLATDDQFVLRAWNRGAQRMFGWTAEEAVGRLAYELIPTSFADDELAAEMSSLVEHGRWRGEATWHGKHGRAVYAEAKTIALRSDNGEATGYLCIIRDLSERQEARKELEMRARQQALLGELTLRNLVNGELQDLLDEATALVARTLEVELSSIGELLPGREGVRWRAAHGWPEDAIANAPASPATSASLVGYVLGAGAPVISEDVSTDGRFQISGLFAAQRPVSAISVVIPVKHQRFGVLTAASKSHRRFTSADVDFVQAVANILGIAVERSRMEEQLSDVREGERRRIARDLHDDALNRLSAALAQAILARSRAATDAGAEPWNAQIVALKRLGQQLRSAIYDLRLGGEAGRPWVEVVAELVAHHAELGGDCSIILNGREALPTGALGKRGTEVLQIVGEALTNARRHSGAKTIIVDASDSDVDVLRLKVTDDGGWRERRSTGIETRGTGITGMTERADLLGADLNIERPPGGGTVLSLELRLALER